MTKSGRDGPDTPRQRTSAYCADLIVDADNRLVILDAMIVGGRTNKDHAGGDYGKHWVYEAAELLEDSQPGTKGRRQCLPGGGDMSLT